jgi:succinate dehydrogenase / fumarate reductase membrane anchor subunit
MKSASQHWWLQRVSAVVLIPLVGWIAIFVLGRMSADYEGARGWLGQPLNGGLMIVSLFVLYWHARLGLQVIAEDYVANSVRRRRLLLGVNGIVLFWIAAAVVAVCAIMRF